MTQHVRVSLLASDTAQERAAKILVCCGMTTGDPKQLADIMHWMTHCIAKYQEADRAARHR